MSIGRTSQAIRDEGSGEPPHRERSRTMIKEAGGTRGPCHPRDRALDARGRLRGQCHSGGGGDPPPPIAAEPLTQRSVFPDEIDMKFKLKLHGGRHHGQGQGSVPNGRRQVHGAAGRPVPLAQPPRAVIVNIVSGSLTYIPADTCHERTYSAGQSFVDPGHGHVHSAINRGTEPMVFVATFFEAPGRGHCSFRRPLVANEISRALRRAGGLQPSRRTSVRLPE